MCVDTDCMAVVVEALMGHIYYIFYILHIHVYVMNSWNILVTICRS